MQNTINCIRSASNLGLYFTIFQVQTLTLRLSLFISQAYSELKLVLL
jgi:hypothetical protein